MVTFGVELDTLDRNYLFIECINITTDDLFKTLKIAATFQNKHYHFPLIIRHCNICSLDQCFLSHMCTARSHTLTQVASVPTQLAVSSSLLSSAIEEWITPNTIQSSSKRRIEARRRLENHIIELAKLGIAVESLYLIKYWGYPIAILS